MVENNTFVVNTAESLHKAAEAALAVGGATQLTYFGAKLLVEQGLAACARQAAVLIATSTAINYGSQQAVALAQEHGVNPDYIRIGADAIQVILLWKAAKANRQGCFVAGTQVLVGYDEQGQPLTRNIEDLQVGDRVLSRSELDESDDLDLRAIAATSSHKVYQLQTVEVSDGNGNVESLESTIEHPYYVPERGWTRADELEAGDLLLSDDGTQRTVASSVTENAPDGVLVYNLTVEDDHTYFVEDGTGSQEFVWVHNAGACNPLGPSEVFKSPADAIGDLQGTATKVGSGFTKDPQWKEWGYSETHYYRDSNGTKWTVFFNPKRKLFSGAHESSGQ